MNEPYAPPGASVSEPLQPRSVLSSALLGALCSLAVRWLLGAAILAGFVAASGDFKHGITNAMGATVEIRKSGFVHGFAIAEWALGGWFAARFRRGPWLLASILAACVLAFLNSVLVLFQTGRFTGVQLGMLALMPFCGLAGGYLGQGPEARRDRP
jgi:hypothetical protein